MVHPNAIVSRDRRCGLLALDFCAIRSNSTQYLLKGWCHERRFWLGNYLFPSVGADGVRNDAENLDSRRTIGADGNTCDRELIHPSAMGILIYSNGSGCRFRTGTIRLPDTGIFDCAIRSGHRLHQLGLNEQAPPHSESPLVLQYVLPDYNDSAGANRPDPPFFHRDSNGKRRVCQT